jgi:hypothetical protein
MEHGVLRTLYGPDIASILGWAGTLIFSHGALLGSAPSADQYYTTGTHYDAARMLLLRCGPRY